LKSRKTFSNWLNNKYLLIIRNEENFAEKTTISFTYAKVIVVSFSLFVVLLFISLILSKTLMAKWFDPRYEQFVMSRQLIDLRIKFDSLAQQVELKDNYLKNIQSILKGEIGSEGTSQDSISSDKVEVKELSKPLAEIDSQFRKEFEEDEPILPENKSGSYLQEINNIFFFSPLRGIITQKYEAKTDHFGVDVVSNSNEPIHSVADGTVLFTGWTQDAGNVIMIQHTDNTISVYKHNSALLKKVGNFVEAGEVIAIIGNTGELTSGPHLHFELWYNGNPVDPEEFISF